MNCPACGFELHLRRGKPRCPNHCESKKKPAPATKRAPNTTEDGGLACAFGEPWMGPHPLCEAEVDRSIREFHAAVARGEYDAEGYTPAERRMQAQRAGKKGLLF